MDWHDQDAGSLEQYRGYLRGLAEEALGCALQPKLDASDVVQETFLRAQQNLDQLRGAEQAQVAAWLRQILTRVVANFWRDYHRQRRDVRRERRFDGGSERLRARARKDPSSASADLRDQEVLVRVSHALLALPDDQREALMLEHWQALSLEEVGERMGRSRAAVAGLIRRGLKQLRRELRKLG